MGPTETQKYLKLINDSKLISAAEKFSWSNALPMMTPPQLLELETILSQGVKKPVEPQAKKPQQLTTPGETITTSTPAQTSPQTPQINWAQSGNPSPAVTTPSGKPVITASPPKTQTLSHLSNLPKQFNAPPSTTPQSQANLLKPKLPNANFSPKSTHVLPTKAPPRENKWPLKHLVAQVDPAGVHKKLHNLQGLANFSWEDFASIGEGQTIQAIIALMTKYDRLPVRVAIQASPLFRDYVLSGATVLSERPSETLTLAEFETIADIMRAL